MSYLYPRLLSDQATRLFGEYRELSLEQIAKRVATSHESAVYVATGGDRIPEAGLTRLRNLVLDLAVDAGFPEPATRAQNTDFDLQLAALLHAEMGLVPAEAASRDIWAFLAMVVLPDVAYWRYPEPPRDRVLGTDLTRHVFGRLWWRAQLVHSSGEPEPYSALGILGEAAFDQIYARRAALGGSPHTVRAILRVWNELDLRNLNEREALRDFLKRLLRLAPFVLFDGIEELALDEELRAVANESVAALREVSSSGSSAPMVSKYTSAPISFRTHSHRATRFTSLEICAGSGSQALGLERAGFEPILVVDHNAKACETIRLNRPHWNVRCSNIESLDALENPEILNLDLISGGLPRIKSAAAAARLDDEVPRRVFETTLRLVALVRPKAVLIENLADLAVSPDFAAERSWIGSELADAGYRSNWAVLDSADFGVPQHRKSGFLVAFLEPFGDAFRWPQSIGVPAPTVGEVLGPSMASRGWPGAAAWSKHADRLAPSLVGGSDNRGGADLGPTGSKRAWAALGINGNSLGDDPPAVDFPVDGHPKLTVRQAAMIQSIPDDWRLAGGKTAEYRQVGHALPPPVAEALGHAIAYAIQATEHV